MSDGSRDERPLYGEYATPEEQRARILQPDASVALGTGVSPARTPARQAHAPSPAAAAPAAGAAASEASPRRSADRIITIGLLVSGLITVVMSAFSLIDFPTVATLSMQMAGIPGEFTNVDQGRMFGAIAAVALVVGWVVTALGSVGRLRAGRIAWWVPLTGAAVTYAIVYALLIPAILGDPAVIGFLGSSTP